MCYPWSRSVGHGRPCLEDSPRNTIGEEQLKLLAEREAGGRRRGDLVEPICVCLEVLLFSQVVVSDSVTP